MQTEHSPFPSDETLAAYIDGRLDEETRKRVVEHMAECPECLDVVMGGREVARVAESRRRVVAWPRKAVISLAAAAVVAMGVFLTPIRDRVWPRDDIRALAAVAPPERFSDGRIADFPYQLRAKTMRGGENDVTKNPEYWKFWQVAARVLDEAKKHRDGNTLHADGVSRLMIGNNKGAVTDLEDALREQSHETDLSKAISMSSDAKLINDLSAAYIGVGAYQQALSAAERAWQLAQTPATAWNRAMATDLLKGREAAAARWRDYLAVDANSQWANEARARLKIESSITR